MGVFLGLVIGGICIVIAAMFYGFVFGVLFFVILPTLYFVSEYGFLNTAIGYLVIVSIIYIIIKIKNQIKG